MEGGGYIAITSFREAEPQHQNEDALTNSQHWFFLSQVSSNSKIVSWGGESFDVDTETYSDSGRGTEILEREQKPILDGEKINVKIPVGMKGNQK